jgi:hypothetical protein
MSEMIKRPDVIKEVENQLNLFAKANNFNSLEKVRDNFCLTSEEFPQG